MPERGIQYNNGEKYSCFECNIEDKSVYVYQIKHPSRSCKVVLCQDLVQVKMRFSSS